MKRLGFIVFLLGVAALTSLAYRYFNQEWVIYRKAENLFSNQAFSEAIPFYEELLKKDFQAPGLLRHLGSCYLATGNEPRARSVFEKMLARGEDRLGSMKELASIYESMGRFQEAAALYQEVLQQTPEDDSVRVRLARLLFWTGRLEQAIHEYRKALEEKN